MLHLDHRELKYLSNTKRKQPFAHFSMSNLFIQRYDIDFRSDLGKGGYGQVVTAKDSILKQKTWAIKIIRRVFRCPDFALRILRELIILHRSSHPYIMKVADAYEIKSEESEEVHIVMEKMTSDLYIHCSSPRLIPTKFDILFTEY